MMRGVSRRWFGAGAIGLMVVAVLHAMGHFGGGPKDMEGIALTTAMQMHQVPIMGMNPSAYDITRSLSLTMFVMLLFVGVLDLVVARSADPVLLRRFAVLNVTGVSVLVALFTYYRIPPPLVTLAVVDVFFLTSVLRSPRLAE